MMNYHYSYFPNPHDWFFSGVAYGLFLPFFLALALVAIVLEGYALWYSARNGQKWWFIALLVIHTFGILDIIYLIFFRNPKTPSDEETVTVVPEPEAEKVASSDVE